MFIDYPACELKDFFKALTKQQQRVSKLSKPPLLLTFMIDYI
jgi:hypothetical protein